MIPLWIETAIEAAFGVPPAYVQPVGGGDVAASHRVRVSGDDCFLKWMVVGGEALESESVGLQVLAAAGSGLIVPQVRLTGTSEDGEAGFLLMEWIEPSPADEAYWRRLGTGLASLHGCTDRSFGFQTDNFIGATPQPNGASASWPDFFGERRLGWQAHLARQSGRWRIAWDAPFERLLARLDALLPRVPPASLVHGDLWRGNTFPNGDGMPVLVDPAVYYGHGEVDIAMSELFGRFGSAFYASYWQKVDQEPGYRDRREVYNLYHLLNHLNLFGQGYGASVEGVLARFG